MYNVQMDLSGCLRCTVRAVNMVGVLCGYNPVTALWKGILRRELKASEHPKGERVRI